MLSLSLRNLYFALTDYEMHMSKWASPQTPTYLPAAATFQPN